MNVHFCYPSRPDVEVLRGVTLSAAAGECVALVGASGSGKSTVIHLLSHFYEAQIGTVAVDGKRVEDWDAAALRSVVATVGQEPVLMSGSVKENVLYGLVGRAGPGSEAFNAEFGAVDEDGTEGTGAAGGSGEVEGAVWRRGGGGGDAEKEKMEAELVGRMTTAAKMANAAGFVSRLPKGYETEVGERGVQLSGGQKQRIAIARTLVVDPRVLLLDEATSALDAESESVVQQALERAMRGRTTIVIAHRLSTVRNADKIIVMAAGRVVEQGTHNELMRRPLIKGRPSYRALVRQQMFSSK